MLLRKLLPIFALLSCSLVVASPALPEEPRAWAEKHLEEIVKLYQHFHAHPELSFMEKETAARLAKELRAAGVEVTENVGGTGVVGLLKNGSGKTIMLRCDLDAGFGKRGKEFFGIADAGEGQHALAFERRQRLRVRIQAAMKHRQAAATRKFRHMPCASSLADQ